MKVIDRSIRRTGLIVAFTAKRSCSAESMMRSPAATSWTRSRTGRTPTMRDDSTDQVRAQPSNIDVLRPLADAGMTKLAVRTVARDLGLTVADKPAAPCFASRIPHHHPVTPAKLSQIERAEAALRQLGFGDLRVRHHDEVARSRAAPR